MEELLTRKEAAKLLGISIVTLDAARANGLVSFVQYCENGSVYFTEMSLLSTYGESRQVLKMRNCHSRKIKFPKW